MIKVLTIEIKACWDCPKMEVLRKNGILSSVECVLTGNKINPPYLPAGCPLPDKASA